MKKIGSDKSERSVKSPDPDLDSRLLLDRKMIFFLFSWLWTRQHDETEIIQEILHFDRYPRMCVYYMLIKGTNSIHYVSKCGHVGNSEIAGRVFSNKELTSVEPRARRKGLCCMMLCLSTAS